MMSLETSQCDDLTIITTRAARVALLSVVSVCDFVCLFVWMTVNTITTEPLTISLRDFHGVILGSEGRPSSNMAVVGCADGDLISDVLLCNVGAPWRTTMKELTHTITERCTSGDKTSLMFELLTVILTKFSSTVIVENIVGLTQNCQLVLFRLR